jgi:hypothetical protein
VAGWGFQEQLSEWLGEAGLAGLRLSAAVSRRPTRPPTNLPYQRMPAHPPRGLPSCRQHIRSQKGQVSHKQRPQLLLGAALGSESEQCQLQQQQRRQTHSQVHVLIDVCGLRRLRHIPQVALVCQQRVIPAGRQAAPPHSHGQQHGRQRSALAAGRQGHILLDAVVDASHVELSVDVYGDRLCRCGQGRWQLWGRWV